jgi:hypothetical protein
MDSVAHSESCGYYLFGLSVMKRLLPILIYYQKKEDQVEKNESVTNPDGKQHGQETAEA